MAKWLRSKINGGLYGYSEEKAKNTSKWEVYEDEEPKPKPKRTRRKKAPAKPETSEVLEELEGLLNDDADNDS